MTKEAGPKSSASKAPASKANGKRKADTPAVERQGKRARSHVPDSDSDDGREDSHDTDVLDGEEGSGADPSEEGNSGPVSEFDRIIDDAEAGRVLERSGRVRRPPSRAGTAAPSASATAFATASRTEGRGVRQGKSKGKGKAAENETGSRSKKSTSRSSKRSRTGGKPKTDSFPRPPSRARLSDSAATRPITGENHIRRVRAERRVDGATFYLVDTYPTWVGKASVPRRDISDWSKNKTEFTLEWGHDTVLKVKNPTSDDEAPLVRQLLESVLSMYKEYLCPDSVRTGRDVMQLAEELFTEEDWLFRDGTEERAAIISAMLVGDVGPNAAEVLRHTFVEAWNQRAGVGSEERRYGDIRVRYRGEVDGEAGERAVQPGNGVMASTVIDPVFADELWDERFMDVDKWPAEGISEHVRQLSTAVARLVRTCPYMLSQPWPGMLAGLFFWDEKLEAVVNDGEFQFSLMPADEEGEREDWRWRFADQFAYTYIDECEWEHRCVDEVWATFVAAQEFVEGHVDAANDDGNEDGEDGGGKDNPPTTSDDTHSTDPGRSSFRKASPPPMRGTNGEGPSGSRRVVTGPNTHPTEESSSGPGPRRPTRGASEGQRGSPRDSSGDSTSDSSATEIPHRAPSPATLEARRVAKAERRRESVKREGSEVRGKGNGKAS